MYNINQMYYFFFSSTFINLQNIGFNDALNTYYNPLNVKIIVNTKLF